MRSKTLFCIPLGLAVLTIDRYWVVIAPAASSALALLYVPILGSYLNLTETWMVAVVIAGLSGVSLVAHVWAHLGMAWATGSEIPGQIPLYPLGDAAQGWPAAPSAWRDFWVAVAGPLTSLLLAGVAYLLWNAQLHPYATIVASFLIFFNAGVAAINLTPAFPLDGGRLLRAVGWGLLAQPVAAIRLGTRGGYLLVAALVGWAIVLLVQQTRVSLQTSTSSLLLATLLWLMLYLQPVWQWDRPRAPRSFHRATLTIRALLAGLLILSLWAITVSLAPLNQGLEAPGPVVSVMPMVSVPAAYRHRFTGTFLLTTVMPQTPILVGQWLYGQWSPDVALMRPEQIVPPDTSVQKIARQQYQMLEESETTAVVVGLRLAGYPVKATGRGVRVLSVLPESTANGLLQADDIIIGVEDVTVGTPAELTARLNLYTPQSRVHVHLERTGSTQMVTVALLSSSEPDHAPRLGITVESAGITAELPFAVKIEPQKVTGGPSAGLMFALTVYDLVTPEALTGGRMIAGTGTINLDGGVGPIGGIQQKVAGAERAGAEYFLAPAENYQDAQAVARRIKVVKVETAVQAIQFLRSLPSLEGQP